MAQKVVYSGGGARGLSTQIRSIKPASDLKAKVDEIQNKVNADTDSIKSLKSQGDNLISAMERHDRITSQVDRHDLEQYGKFWDGMEKLTGAVVEHAKEKRDEARQEGWNNYATLGSDYGLIQKNNEVYEQLRAGNEINQELAAKISKITGNENFAEKFASMGRQQKWGFHLAHLQAQNANLTLGYNEFRNDENNQQINPFSGSAWHVNGNTFTLENYDKLNQEQQGTVRAAFLDVHNKKLDTKGYNRGVLQQYVYQPISKWANDTKKKESEVSIVMNAGDNIDSYEQTIGAEVIALKGMTDPVLKEQQKAKVLQLLRGYRNTLGRDYATLNRFGTTAENPGTTSLKRFDQLLSTLAKDNFENDDVITDIIAPLLTETKRPVYNKDGSLKLDKDNKQVYEKITLPGLKKGTEHSLGQLNLLNLDKYKGENLVAFAQHYNKKNNATIGSARKLINTIETKGKNEGWNQDRYNKEYLTILKSPEGQKIANNPQALAILKAGTIDRVATTLGPDESAIQLTALITDVNGNGKFVTPEQVQNFDATTVEHFKKVYGLEVTDGEVPPKEAQKTITGMEQELMLAAGGKRNLTTAGTMGSEWPAQMRQVIQTQILEVRYAVQNEALAIKAKTGVMPDLLPLYRKHIDLKKAEFAAGAQQDQDSTDRLAWNKQDGYYNYSDARTIDSSLLVNKQYSENIKQFNLLRSRYGDLEITKIAIFKDRPEALDLVGGQIPADIQIMARQLGLLPKDFVAQQRELIGLEVESGPHETEAQQVDLSFNHESYLGLNEMFAMDSIDFKGANRIYNNSRKEQFPINAAAFSTTLTGLGLDFDYGTHIAAFEESQANANKGRFLAARTYFRKTQPNDTFIERAKQNGTTPEFEALKAENEFISTLRTNGILRVSPVAESSGTTTSYDTTSQSDKEASSNDGVTYRDYKRGVDQPVKAPPNAKPGELFTDANGQNWRYQSGNPGFWAKTRR